MWRLLAAFLAAAMLAAAGTDQQATGGNPDPAKERANVERIYARIQAHRPESARKQGAARVTIPNTTVSYDIVPVPAGEFEMGSAAGDTNQKDASQKDASRKKDEQPRHKVRVDAFWMQAREVTWDEYRLFMFDAQGAAANPKEALVDAVSRPTRPYVEMSFGMGIDGFPAISMTQHAANKYAEWLSAKLGEFYRLPTEAEWEYACRAGAATAYPFGNDPSKLADYAWYSADSDGKYHQVGTKKPNQWGLYDMLGNVMEWTLDQYAPYKAAAESNPWIAAAQPYPHAVRGGSWNDPADMLRCAARVASDPSWKQQDPQLPKSIWYETDAQWLGFRLVRPVKIPGVDQMYRYWNSGVEDDQ